MTLPNSGSISLPSIQTEFGGTNPTSISEYYRGGAYVPSTYTNRNIPTSGTILFSDFYGSSDTELGIVWTSANSGIAAAQSLRHMAANTSNTVIVTASSGNIYLSTNYGSTWTIKPTGSTVQLWGCEYALGNWYIIDYTGDRVQRSSDGTTWTTVLNVATSDHHKLTYNDGYFVLGSGRGGGNGYIYGSVDGTTWTKSPDVGANSARCGIYVSALNRTFAAGNEYKYYTGIPTSISAWTANPTGLAGVIHSVAWSPTLGYACAVSTNGNIYKSTNLISWTNAYVGTTALYNIKWCENQFIAVGDTGTILTSYDATTWTTRTSGLTTTLYGIGNITSSISGSALFVAGDSSSLVVSL